MPSNEISNKLGDLAKRVRKHHPDMASIKASLETLTPEVEHCDAPRALEAVSLIRSAISDLANDRFLPAATSLGEAALKIKDHSRTP